jgi:hypothetical protein
MNLTNPVGRLGADSEVSGGGRWRNPVGLYSEQTVASRLRLSSWTVTDSTINHLINWYPDAVGAAGSRRWPYASGRSAPPPSAAARA